MRGRRRKRMRERKKKEEGNREQEARHVLIIPTRHLVGCPLYPQDSLNQGGWE